MTSTRPFGPHRLAGGSAKGYGRGSHALYTRIRDPRFPDNSARARERRKDDDWRHCEASRPDPPRDTGVKCFDCFEWRCRMSITRRRLDVETGTFESGACPVQRALCSDQSRNSARKPCAKPRQTRMCLPAGHTCIHRGRCGERTRSTVKKPSAFMAARGRRGNRSRRGGDGPERALIKRVTLPYIRRRGR